MFKIRQKLLAILGAGIITLSSVTSVSAINYSSDAYISVQNYDTYLNLILPKKIKEFQAGKTNIKLEDLINEYVGYSLPNYLQANGLYDSYEVSGLFKLCNYDGNDVDKYILIISKDKNMIASLTVGFTGNNIVSAFRVENIPEVNESIKTNSPMIFGYSNNCFLLYSNDKFSIIENVYNTDTKFIEELNVNQDALNEYSAEAIAGTTSVVSERSMASSHYVSGITIVPNAVCPDTNVGLCWTACVACMAKQNNSTGTFSALSVYNDCKTYTGTDKPNDGETYPHGSVAWTKLALKIEGIYPTTDTSALTASQIGSILDAGKPILVRVFPNTSVDDGHGLVLFNYIENTSTNGTYIFMDPASPSTAGILSINVGSNVLNNGDNLILVSRDNNTYSNWRTSIYKS